MCNLKSFKRCGGKMNTAGTRTKLRVTCACSLTAFPKTVAALALEADPAAVLAIGDTVKLGEAFAMTVGATWKEVDILVNTGSITDTLEGEVGGQGYKSGFTFFVQGTDAAQLEFANEVAAASGALVMQIQDKMGNWRVLGRHDDPAYIESAELTTGLVNGDRRGGAYVASATVGTVAPIYDEATLGLDVEVAVEV